MSQVRNTFFFCCSSTQFRVMASPYGASRLHLLHTSHSQAGLLWMCDRPGAETSTLQHTTLTRDKLLYLGGIRTHNPDKRAAADPRLRPRGHWGHLRNIFYLLKRSIFCTYPSEQEVAILLKQMYAIFFRQAAYTCNV